MGLISTLNSFQGIRICSCVVSVAKMMTSLNLLMNSFDSLQVRERNEQIHGVWTWARGAVVKDGLADWWEGIFPSLWTLSLNMLPRSQNLLLSVSPFVILTFPDTSVWKGSYEVSCTFPSHVVDTEVQMIHLNLGKRLSRVSFSSVAGVSICHRSPRRKMQAQAEGRQDGGEQGAAREGHLPVCSPAGWGQGHGRLWECPRPHAQLGLPDHVSHWE